MLAALQVCTHCLILFLLSSAVLAAVVIHAPLKALGSQTGVGAGIGVGVGLLLLFFVQEFNKRRMLKRTREIVLKFLSRVVIINEMFLIIKRT